MEQILAQCGSLFSAQSPLFLSVLLGGLIGSLSHCSVMCSPLVVSQMLALREKGRAPSTLWFYHAGRISTYTLLGVLVVLVGRKLFSAEVVAMSRLMLMLAGAVFIVSALMPRKTHACCNSRTQWLQEKMARLPWPALHHYLRGMLMGFMPCGLLLSALLMVGTLPSAASAAAAMLLFGVATIPALQAAARLALSLGNRYPQAGARFGRVVMAVNGMFLCGVGLNLVRVS